MISNLLVETQTIMVLHTNVCTPTVVNSCLIIYTHCCWCMETQQVCLEKPEIEMSKAVCRFRSSLKLEKSRLAEVEVL